MSAKKERALKVGGEKVDAGPDMTDSAAKELVKVALKGEPIPDDPWDDEEDEDDND